MNFTIMALKARNGVSLIVGAKSGNAPLVVGGAAGLTVSAVASTASSNNVRKHGQAADKAQKRASLELEKKWEAEKRWKVYDEGKVKGGNKR